MRTFLALQECNRCGRSFYVEYREDRTYEYVGVPCECDEGFSPALGVPSISQWFESGCPEEW